MRVERKSRVAVWVKHNIFPSAAVTATFHAIEFMNESKSTNSTVTLNRTFIGLIAAVMLVAGGVLWVAVGDQSMCRGSCIKVGLVMAAVWLAIPAMTRNRSWGEASWTTVALFLLAALFLIGKRVDFRIVVGILFGTAITLTFLRPRSKPR